MEKQRDIVISVKYAKAMWEMPWSQRMCCSFMEQNWLEHQQHSFIQWLTHLQAFVKALGEHYNYRLTDRILLDYEFWDKIAWCSTSSGVVITFRDIQLRFFWLEISVNCIRYILFLNFEWIVVNPVTVCDRYVHMMCIPWLFWSLKNLQMYLWFVYFCLCLNFMLLKPKKLK